MFLMVESMEVPPTTGGYTGVGNGCPALERKTKRWVGLAKNAPGVNSLGAASGWTEAAS